MLAWIITTFMTISQSKKYNDTTYYQCLFNGLNNCPFHVYWKLKCKDIIKMIFITSLFRLFAMDGKEYKKIIASRDIICTIIRRFMAGLFWPL